MHARAFARACADECDGGGRRELCAGESDAKTRGPRMPRNILAHGLALRAPEGAGPLAERGSGTLHRDGARVGPAIFVRHVRRHRRRQPITPSAASTSQQLAASPQIVRCEILTAQRGRTPEPWPVCMRYAYPCGVLTKAARCSRAGSEGAKVCATATHCGSRARDRDGCFPTGQPGNVKRLQKILA